MKRNISNKKPIQNIGTICRVRKVVDRKQNSTHLGEQQEVALRRRVRKLTYCSTGIFRLIHCGRISHTQRQFDDSKKAKKKGVLTPNKNWKNEGRGA
jgi:hypothetical protein